jgi:hypothetical protein
VRFANFMIVAIDELEVDFTARHPDLHPGGPSLAETAHFFASLHAYVA